MAQLEEAMVVRAEPKFISYLLNPNSAHDTYFFIGKEKTKIGVVRKMLAAHSEVLRSELEDRQLGEEVDIYVEDISSETFKNLLRYVYGYNNISMLYFDDADDLLYAADKFLIQDLKDQLSLRIMDLLDSHNICRLLNNPACHTALELNAKITEILQYETDAVFDNSEFVNMRVESFIKILEQNTLFATELEVWKAALKWAKNQACSEDGSVLRKYISQLKHIRIHCIKLEEFCTEVVPKHVLSYEEVIEICASHKKDEKPRIEGFSEKTYQRHEELNISTKSTITYSQSSFTITPTHDILLLPFEFKANNEPTDDYYCDVTIDVFHVSSSSNSSLNPQTTVRFKEKVNCRKLFKVALPPNCKKLLFNNSYKITITFNILSSHYVCNHSSYSSTSVSLHTHSTAHGFYILPFKSLKYIKCA